jgi:hypothetical protein
MMARAILVTARTHGSLFGLSASLLALVFLSPGCGPARGDVSGRVRLEGKAVTSGTVMLIGRDGVPHYGEIAEDGNFAVTDVLAGPATATVSSPDPNHQATKGPRKKGANDKERSGPTEAQKRSWFALPARYADPQQSGIEINVAPGANHHDIELKK